MKVWWFGFVWTTIVLLDATVHAFVPYSPLLVRRYATNTPTTTTTALSEQQHANRIVVDPLVPRRRRVTNNKKPKDELVDVDTTVLFLFTNLVPTSINQTVEEMQTIATKMHHIHIRWIAQKGLIQQFQMEKQADAQTCHDCYVQWRSDPSSERGLFWKRQHERALDRVQVWQQKLDAHGAAVDKLAQSLQVLDQTMVIAQSKRDQMAARVRMAQETLEEHECFQLEAALKNSTVVVIPPLHTKKTTINVPTGSWSASFSTTTALLLLLHQANLLGPFLDVAKSHVHVMVSNRAEQLMDEFVKELQHVKDQVLLWFLEWPATLCVMLKEAQEQHADRAEECYKNAQFILSAEQSMDNNNNTSLASFWLKQSERALDKAMAIQAQIDVVDDASDKLCQSHEWFDQTIMTAARNHRDELFMNAIDRMEQKLQALEAAADAYWAGTESFVLPEKSQSM